MRNKLIYRGIMKLLDYPKQIVQLLTNSDITEEVERHEPYGFSSHPPQDNEGLIVFPNADKNNGICFQIGDERAKPPLKKGEVCVYHDKENYLLLKEDETLLMRGKLRLSLKNDKLKVSNESQDLFSVLNEILTLIQNHKTITSMGLMNIGSDDITKVGIIKDKLKELLR